MKRDFGSHLQADLMGWKFTADYGDVIGAIHAIAFLNSNRDQKEHPTSYTLPLPWSDPDESEVFTAEEISVARAELLRRSAFAE